MTLACSLGLFRVKIITNPDLIWVSFRAPTCVCVSNSAACGRCYPILLMLYCCTAAVLLYCCSAGGWQRAFQVVSTCILSRAAMVVQQYALKNEMSVEAAKHFIIFNHQQRRTLPPLKVRM